MQATLDTTIRDIVAGDFRTAAVFERYRIDFCCKGDRPLARACEEAGVPVDALLKDLAAVFATDRPDAPSFADWTCSALVSHIVNTHHAYVRQAIPTLLAHTTKVAEVHGGRHPELNDIARLFAGVATEMDTHMFKEERILFPHIVAAEQAIHAGRPAGAPPFGTVANPIHMMEMEHESAGDAMARIRELSNAYQPPEDACTTYQACLRELEAFENDLHGHVHLENNILFPKAIQMEKPV
jgi:regulator of cell morphogenesis and NO signaling